MNDIIVIRGAGDLASGIAHKLHSCGFRVILTEIEKPLVVRRYASFANAVIEGKAILEGVRAVKADCVEDIQKIWKNADIPVLCDRQCNIIDHIKPLAVIDAILAKKNLGTHRGMAPITIGVGPGFEAKEDVDAVIETHRGHNLGKAFFNGSADADTGIPGNILGYTWERLLRAPCSGVINHVLDIGNYVKKGDVIAYVAGEPVCSLIDGIVRGLIANGQEVQEGLKIGDVDPRGIKENCFTISDKSRAVAGGVLEALLYLKRMKSCA